MPSYDVRTFDEPGECAEALRGAKVEMTVVGCGHFSAEFTVIDLNGLRLQRMSESLPLIYHSANMGGRANFLFQICPGPSLFRDGVEITSDSLVRRLDGPQSHSVRSSGPMNWGSMSLRLEDIPSVSEAVGFDLTPPKSERIIKPCPSAIANLQRLHSAAALVATEAPEVINNPEGARGLEQILLQALIACLEGDDVREKTPTQGHHQKLMQRFYAILKADPARPLYIAEVAAAIGTSIRALSSISQQHLGIGPKRYLLLRRMHLVRQALINAHGTASTVTDIATEHGFWQFGRFAGEYKSLFGESPSVTLRKSEAGHATHRS
jgi:AraC-like DNA-binding protein